MATRQTHAGGKLLTRKPAADAIGVSESTFRRRFENVVLTPIKENGIHRFVEAEVLEVAMRYRREHAGRADLEESADAEDRGKFAARVFTAFDEGLTQVDVVKKFEIDPDRVEPLHAQWVRMRRGFVVMPDAAEAIHLMIWHEHPVRREGPVRSVAELEAWLYKLSLRFREHATAASATCTKCHVAPRTICAKCYENNLEAEKTRRVEIIESAKQNRAFYKGE